MNPLSNLSLTSVEKKIIFFMTLYLLFHLVIRIFLSSTLQLDDSEQIFFGQEFHLGYPIPQPPLYTWLSWLAFKMFGTSLATISVIKYILIFLTFVVLLDTVRFLNLSKYSLYFLFLSFLLMPSFAWHMHQGFTHTILLGFATFFTINTLIKLRYDQSQKRYFLFGVAVAVGLLSKYSYVIFLFSLIFSTFFVKSYRKIILNKKVFTSLIVIVFLTFPNIYWLTTSDFLFSDAVEKKLSPEVGLLSLNNIKSALIFFKSSIGFIFPIIIFYLFAFLIRKKYEKTKQKTDEIVLFSWFYFIIFSIAISLAIFVSIPHIKVRWLHPIFMIFPIIAVAMIDRYKNLSKKIFRPLFIFAIFISTFIFSIRILQSYVGPDLGYYGRLNRPIMEAIENLTLNKHDKLITLDGFLGSHLLIMFPNNNIKINEKEVLRQKSSSVTNCIYIWDDDSEADLDFYDMKFPEKTSIKLNTANFTYKLSYHKTRNCEI